MAEIAGAKLKKTETKRPAGVKSDEGMAGILAELKEKRTLRKVPIEERKHVETESNPLQAELRNKMRLRKAEDRPVVFNKTAKGVLLKRDSGQGEVRQWLFSKNFSSMCVDKLSGFTGSDLFDMSKDDYKSVCGFGEGVRVFAEVEKDKEETEPKSELQELMKRQQEEAERRAPHEEAEPQKVPSEDEEDASKPAWLRNLKKAKRQKKEAEERAEREAEERAKREAEETARLEAEEQARLEAEEKARLEAEENAKVETDVMPGEEAAKKTEDQPEEAQEEKATGNEDEKEAGESKEEEQEKEEDKANKEDSESSSEERLKKKKKGKSKGKEVETERKDKKKDRRKPRKAKSTSASSRGSCSLSTSSEDERSAKKRSQQRKKSSRPYPSRNYQAKLPHYMATENVQAPSHSQLFQPHSQPFQPHSQPFQPHGYSQPHPPYQVAPVSQNIFPATAQVGPNQHGISPQVAQYTPATSAIHRSFNAPNPPYPTDFEIPAQRHQTPYPPTVPVTIVAPNNLPYPTGASSSLPNPTAHGAPSNLPYPTGNKPPYPTSAVSVSAEIPLARRGSHDQARSQFSAEYGILPQPPATSTEMQSISVDAPRIRRSSQGQMAVPYSAPSQPLRSDIYSLPMQSALPQISQPRRGSQEQGSVLIPPLTNGPLVAPLPVTSSVQGLDDNLSRRPSLQTGEATSQSRRPSQGILPIHETVSLLGSTALSTFPGQHTQLNQSVSGSDFAPSRKPSYPQLELPLAPVSIAGQSAAPQSQLSQNSLPESRIIPPPAMFGPSDAYFEVPSGMVTSIPQPLPQSEFQNQQLPLASNMVPSPLTAVQLPPSIPSALSQFGGEQVFFQMHQPQAYTMQVPQVELDMHARDARIPPAPAMSPPSLPEQQPPQPTTENKEAAEATQEHEQLAIPAPEAGSSEPLAFSRRNHPEE